MNRADILVKVPIFSHLSGDDLIRLSQVATEQVFQAGAAIINEDAIDRGLFVICDGSVDVIKGLGGDKERRLRVLDPYCYFGEMALLDDQVRSASVVAREKTKVLILEQAVFLRELERNPAMAIKLSVMLSHRLRAVEKTMMNTLGSFLPICASCKSVRVVEGDWVAIEKFIKDRSETEISHSICPKCTRDLYPMLADKIYPEKTG